MSVAEPKNRETETRYKGKVGVGSAGRPRKSLSSFDEETLFDFLESGLSKQDICKEMDISIPVLNRFISEMQEKSPVLLQYRSIQSLQLTELQFKILAAITPEKIEEASMKDLVLSYKILKEKEQLIEGKPSEIKGLVSYLIEIEKRDGALAQRLEDDLLEGVDSNSSLTSEIERLETGLSEIENNVCYEMTQVLKPGSEKEKSSTQVADKSSEWELKTGRTIPVLP